MGKSSSKPSRKRRELSSNDGDNSNKTKKSKTVMAADEGSDTTEKQRFNLSDVISDCTERWFLDTLREAKAGDVNMQVLVGQMYNCGYGVPKDADKGKVWIKRASRVRSSAWKVSNKRPGYNASDSDSDELAGDS